ncbi:MAG: hypothetical protein ABI778_01430, partial [Ignavibacteriota bacterium]
MKNKKNYIIVCGAVLLCAATAFGQSIDTCQRWHSWVGISPNSQGEYKMQYDSLRRYIESCGKSDDSYDAFPAMSGAVQLYLPDDTTRYDWYREWLLSVLYLNTTQPYYFCACVDALSSTYAAGMYHKVTNASLAVWNYLRKNHPECLGSNDSAAYVQDTIYARQHGIDPTKLPPLDSIGLSILLKNDVHETISPLPSQYLASFTASENPFRNETKLRFTLNRMAYITIDIFDELGRPFYGTGNGRTFETGDHELVIDGGSLPSG